MFNIGPGDAGHRLWPPNIFKLNQKIMVRIDVGEEVHGRPGVYKLFLQVNNEATSTKLKDWRRKNPHGNLATALIDTNTPKEKQEEVGVDTFAYLIDQAGDNL